MIEYDNILYVRDICEIGGVETFTWQMLQRYKDNDIAIVYKKANPVQLARFKKYCYTYKHDDQKIKCKVAIINWDVSIIDYIDKDADIYQVIHADYTDKCWGDTIPTHERIKNYIAVTKHVQKTFMEMTGEKNVLQCYNPLTISKQDKPLILLSATRLSSEKGKDRMIKLIEELDRQHINYLWYIITNDSRTINNPNVIYLQPSLNIDKWFYVADYVIQLSDTEALSYTINEALYRNVPVIVTPLPYLNEIGVKDGENAYILSFDCSNVESVVKRMKIIPKFNFEPLSCELYDKIVVSGQSKFKIDGKTIVNVNVIRDFRDIKCDNKLRVAGDTFKCDLVRAKELVDYGDVEIKR